HKCGVDLPDDSQFCRKCGQAQGVTPTIGETAAAVAPARVPFAAKTKSSTLLKVACGLPIFFLICWIVWRASLGAFGGHATAPQQPPLRQQKQSLPNGAFAVRALAANNYRYTVPAGAFNIAMKGHFAATGGIGNDIEVFVVTEDEFVNWQNGHPSKALYNSGRVTQDTINLTLPANAATYYVVFNNKFSLFTPKAVEANVDVNFYTQ
ncbi:MAG: zinc ribbon domain-containing protein, partial [Terriglobales bacterium]